MMSIGAAVLLGATACLLSCASGQAGEKPGQPSPQISQKQEPARPPSIKRDGALSGTSFVCSEATEKTEGSWDGPPAPADETVLRGACARCDLADVNAIFLYDDHETCAADFRAAFHALRFREPLGM